MTSRLFILLISVLISACSSYLRLPEVRTTPLELKEKNKCLNGSYSNTGNLNANLWNSILQEYTATDSLALKKETVQLRAVSNKLIELKRFREGKLTDSIYISGTFKDSAFVFKKKRKVGLEPPVFWTYDVNKLKLAINSNKDLDLSERGMSLIFLTIIPIMAADGNNGHAYEKIK